MTGFIKVLGRRAGVSGRFGDANKFLDKVFKTSLSLSFIKPPNRGRAEISAMKNLNLAKEVREQKLAEGQEIGKLVLLAEAKLGELFNQMPKAKENQYTKSATSLREEKAPDESEPAADAEPPAKPKLEVAKQMGFNKNQVADFQKLADNPAACATCTLVSRSRSSFFCSCGATV